jgi:hypothetical protein
VDPVLLKYTHPDQVDHTGYLKERNVDFLLATPNYNRDKAFWSLQRQRLDTFRNQGTVSRIEA